ncbi:hypothetical protein GA0070616_5258 [Micromonospora nigra]|uniref:Uncharacterized protein n=1 Tax=Micromonospora nigra TaxID=145857 RepID=A0A1C6T156_9ACTN|nr:cell wall-active antibiotics response protein [Micromonospora nigra]SCL35556.1 hypothetical protein GA0070616_5258 [Micromonospora nigra]
MAVSGQEPDHRAHPEELAQGGDAETMPEITVFGDAAPVPGVPADETRSSWPYGARLLAAAAVVVLVLGAVAMVLTLSDTRRLGDALTGSRRVPVPPVTVAGQPGGLGAAADRPFDSAPLAGRQRATFELVDGLTVVDLRIEDLGDELYRVAAPQGSAVRPRPEVRGDRVRLRVTRAGGTGPGAVEVLLTSRVAWRLRFTGGVTEQRLDLAGARLAGPVELAGGATRTDLTLPRIRGSLTVRMTGGMNDLTVTVPDGPPVRVRAASGAGTVRVYDVRDAGVAAGALIGSPNWDRSADRVYLDLVAGANTVTVRAG